MNEGEPFILFEVDGAVYGVRAAQVQQVEMLDTITRVPRAPGFVEGVTAVRGQAVPVVSLRSRFQMEPRSPDLRTRLIIIRLGERRIALKVDSAREFTRIAPASIQPPPQGLSEPGVEYIEGVALLGSRLILLIDLHRLFDDSEKEALEKPETLEE